MPATSLGRVGAGLGDGKMLPPPGFPDAVKRQSLENRQTVLDAAQEIHGRGVRKVAGGNRDLDDAETGDEQLDDDLGVEYKVVRVLGEGNRREQAAAIGPIAGVIFG